MKKIKKPTGRITIWNGDFGYEQKFPDFKEDIEETVVKSFLRSIPQSELPIRFASYEKLHENNFDFKVSDGFNESFLELTEMTPVDMNQGFQKLSSIINHYQYAVKLSDLIKKKSNHYTLGTKPIDLLCYHTDYRASIPDTIELIQYFLQQTNIVFRYIFFFSPLSIEGGPIKLLHPSNEKIVLDPESFRKRESHFLVPMNIPSFPVEGLSMDEQKKKHVYLFHINNDAQSIDELIKIEQDKIITITQNTYSDYHDYIADLINALHRLGMLQHENGDTNESAKTFEKAIVLLSEVSNPSFAVIAGNIYHDIALLQLNSGNVDSAKQNLYTALKIRQNIFHHDKIRFNDLAATQALSGRYFEVTNNKESAEKYYTMSLSLLLQMDDNTFRTNHMIAHGFNNLASLYFTFGISENTDNDFRESINIFSQLVDQGHEPSKHDLAEEYLYFAIFLKNQNKKDDASLNLKLAIEKFEALEYSYPNHYKYRIAFCKGHLKELM